MHESTTPVLSPPWTIRTLLEWAASRLTQEGCDEARLHAELLLSHVLRIPRLDLSLEADRRLSDDTFRDFDVLFRRRLNHEPIQYIIGKVEFYGLEFLVSPSVLIPRPETELLVERVLGAIRDSNQKTMEVLDIGTGSGNIAVAVGKYAPAARVTAIDVSPQALALAADNVRRNVVSNVSLIEADIFDDVLPGRQFEIIVSNPPYVSAAEFHELAPEIRSFEPRIATTDEADGLRFIRRIGAYAQERLNRSGSVFIEIGFDQKESVEKILVGRGFAGVEFFDDYGGIPRVVKALRQ